MQIKVFFIKIQPNTFLLERRPSEGILGGLLGFPTTEWELKKKEPTFPFKANWDFTKKVVTHQFSHFKLELEIVLGNKKNPKFDKSNDDRAVKSKWTKVTKAPNVIIFEGWCVGATHQKDKMLKKPINLIERNFDKNLKWRKKVNNLLKNDYKKLFGKLDKLVYLKAPNFEHIFQWRLHQEQKLKLTSKNKKTMSKSKVRKFIMYYERITKHMMRNFDKISDLTIFLDNKHRSKKMNFYK